MERLKSLEDFVSLKDRLSGDRSRAVPTIVIPAGTCGQASGANDLIRIAKREMLNRALIERIHLRITGCHGFCEMEPSVLVEPRGTFYPKVGASGMAQIVEAVARGDVIEPLLFLDPGSNRRIERQSEIPFFRRQIRTILSQNERVDPIRIMNYIDDGGYVALAKVLTVGSPEWVIEEVKSSRLRGRGGAGFPTGLKWEMLAKQRNGRGKFVVCNADEGDPGAYMDRSVLEGNPHSIIEGMIIGGYATGATKGVIYVRTEYPLAIKHLVIALRQAHDLGLLGENILGTGFSFEISLVRGAGAFVCGEETALIRSVEGRMGEPRQRPPYPVHKGIDGKPTSINNVETWANVPVVIKNGAAEFVKTGTNNNRGTKIFSLVGKVKYTGLVEVPMGITVGEIVNDIGGGSVSKYRIKAVQTGGPSGGCIPADLFSLPIDYDSLSAAGTIMGSGGMIVMDQNTCMVDLAKYFMNFLKDESCGKCFTCRKGTQRMYEVLDDISRGKGTASSLDLLEGLALVVKDTTMCGLGQSASNPVLSTLRYFRKEYLEHVRQARCAAFVCKELVGAPCQSACPIGTEAWRYIAHIARGEYEDAYRVIREANPFPSVCARVCDHPCEERCRLGTTGDRPVAIRALKRFITDNVDPLAYAPVRKAAPNGVAKSVAVIGSGPAGLTAAHYLSLEGFKVTVYEADDRPGGMLISGIPAYRLRRDVLLREIYSLIDENVTLKCNMTLGKHFTLNSLFEEGFSAVFLAMGAHKSRRLNIEGENIDGVHPAIEFLKIFNLYGKSLAKGRVGVVGGGNSAVDAARVSLRSEGVESVTIFYRRTREDMPALSEEIESAIEEGVRLETLVSPTRIHSLEGRLTSIGFIKNDQGQIDSSGRRRPIPILGSEFGYELDTLIVTIGDEPDIDYIRPMGLAIREDGTLIVDEETLTSNMNGVFAGGDVVTGPRTVVEAIAAGKKVATMISRYLRGEVSQNLARPRLPTVYVEPQPQVAQRPSVSKRVEPPTLDAEIRKRSYAEVELCLGAEDAIKEAERCLRCDLEFTTRSKEAMS
jgi:NADH-quinone oxidoreductase subunit F